MYIAHCPFCDFSEEYLWEDVARGEHVDVRLRTMDGDVDGRAEPGFAATSPDEVVQFERVGFARVDRHGVAESVAYFAHE